MTHLLKGIMFNYIYLLAVFSVLTSFPLLNPTTKWVITQNSSLTINGSTNVNKFSCTILNYPKTDTITINRENNEALLTGTFKLNVKNFECNNVMMTHQFRKTLKHEEFPLLYITFISLKEFPSPNQKNNPIKGLVAIKIAGITKRFDICYEFESLDNTLQLRGSQTVNFSDFKLVAPQRLGKLVKTNDQLSVIFDLKLKKVE